MIIPERIQCDVCKAVKEESARWIVSIESVVQYSLHITFGPSREMFRDQRTGDLPPDAAFADLCGQECAHTQFSRWMESHPDLIGRCARSTTPIESLESEPR